MAEIVEPLSAVFEAAADLPFAFFGYSLGALIAFETARALRRTQRSLPDRLLIAACPAPQCNHAREPLVHRLSEDRFRTELRRFQGTPEAVLANGELMEIVSPMIRADFEVLETYVAAAEPPLEIPIAAYGGLSDADVLSDELALWSEQTAAGFTLQFFPGDHFFLKTAAEPLLAAIRRDLG
jgi:medium-chain acyl-[acyl-carrier-protein] hydrolase